MNILVSAYCVDKQDISEAQMAFEWIYRLSRHVKIHVITMGARIHKECGLEGLSNVKLYSIKPMISFRRFDRFDRACHPGYLEYYLRARKMAEDVVRNNQIDLCHHLSPQAIRFPSPLVNLSVPVIVGPLHGGVYPPSVLYELRGANPWLTVLREIDSLRIKWDPFLRETYDRANRIVISAEYMKNVFPQKYLSKYDIIPGIGVSESLINKGGCSCGNSKIRMLFAGRLVASKGVELAIEATASCINKTVSLSIFGRGPLENYLKKIIYQKNIGNRVELKGFLKQSELFEEIKKCDIFLFPSLIEPAGGALLEALAFGKPVICIDSGGPGYFVDKTCGIKIPIGSRSQMIRDIANAIDNLATDVKLRRQLSEGACERIRAYFTWDKVIQRIIELYSRVLTRTL